MSLRFFTVFIYLFALLCSILANNAVSDHLSDSINSNNSFSPSIRDQFIPPDDKHFTSVNAFLSPRSWISHLIGKIWENAYLKTILQQGYCSSQPNVPLKKAWVVLVGFNDGKSDVVLKVMPNEQSKDMPEGEQLHYLQKHFAEKKIISPFVPVSFIGKVNFCGPHFYGQEALACPLLYNHWDELLKRETLNNTFSALGITLARFHVLCMVLFDQDPCERELNSPTVVHGDLTPKNIFIDDAVQPPNIHFIDAVSAASCLLEPGCAMEDIVYMFGIILHKSFGFHRKLCKYMRDDDLENIVESFLEAYEKEFLACGNISSQAVEKVKEDIEKLKIAIKAFIEGKQDGFIVYLKRYFKCIDQRSPLPRSFQ